LQPSQIILVQNRTVLNQLAGTAMLGPGNQYRTRDCSALAVFLSDLEPSRRIERIYELEKPHRNPAYLAMMPLSTSFLLGEGHASTLVKQVATTLVSETTDTAMPQIEPVESWGSKQTALLAQSFVLGATSHNLATCIMEGFDPRRVKEILRIPDRYGIPMVVATGYDYETEAPASLTPRLNLEEVVFRDTFGEPLFFDEEAEDESSSEEAASSN
jgi:nitroreductase